MRGALLLELRLYCRICPLARPRKAPNSGHIYQPKENQLALFGELAPYAMEAAKAIDTPIVIDITIWLKRKGKTLTSFPVAPCYGDEDNLRKAVNDALVSAELIQNDCLVVGGSTFKLFGPEDEAHVLIYEAQLPKN